MVASVESSCDSFMIKLMLLTGTGSTWTERDPVDRRARQSVSRTEKGWSPITPEGPNRRDETTAHLWCDYELGMSSKQLLYPGHGLSACGTPSQRPHTRTLAVSLVVDTSSSGLRGHPGPSSGISSGAVLSLSSPHGRRHRTIVC
ncbi:hypothetical protein MRS44_010099 [Fusarium solani]|uniref:uncharacterized protein n=1 Tax=Fusarium solani TaxID=169388 RepID=UPI0032C4930B|nr:hypothetical protein MRS44_010099 [Fusarium solani]